jgi:MFS transporter, putative metabolite:H+ symporter
MSFLYQADRMNRTQFGAWVSAFVGWVFDYYEIFLLTFLIVPIGAEFSLEPGQTSYIISVQLLFLAVGGVLFGFLADRFGRQRILMWTIIIYSVFTFARALAPDYSSLLVLTAIAGLGIGGEFGVGQTLISEVMPNQRRGWWSGLYYGGIYLWHHGSRSRRRVRGTRYRLALDVRPLGASGSISDLRSLRCAGV